MQENFLLGNLHEVHKETPFPPPPAGRHGAQEAAARPRVSVCTSAPLDAVRQQNQNLDRALSWSSAPRCSLTAGAAGGAVVLRVAQQVFGHLICRLRQEVAFRAAQQEGAAGDKATNQHAALQPGHSPSS